MKNLCLKTAVENKNCYLEAMKMLAKREYSAFELRQKLTHKDYPEADIAQTISLLIAKDYQNDVRFAQAFIRMRFNQGKGSSLISQQLKQKRVENFDLSGFDFFALAKSVRAKKYGKETPKKPHEKAKQQRFLQSRGFEFEQINQVLKGE